MTIVAGIVTFNPDPDRLRENLAAVIVQVEQVLIVDNASRDSPLFDRLEAEFDGLRIVHNEENNGIARALNQVAEWASVEGAEWILLLDQDSICSPGMVASLARNVEDGIAQIVPAIVDRNLSAAVAAEPGPGYVDYAITSGALSNVKIWKSMGGYDEGLFIDFVDFDFCIRLRTAGYRIVRDPEAVLLHEIGHSRRHGRLVAYNHSAFRSYHMARDMIFYARKHRHTSKDLKVGRRGPLATYMILFRKMVIVALFEEDRFNRVGALIRGMAAETFVRRAHPNG
jgi:rhamnosyltransferase